MRKRDGDEGVEAPLKALPSTGRLVAHVVMRELCYGQKSRIFDRRVEAMIGKAPSVAIS